ncbi:hypothetical protein GCM10027030_19670 [Luteococcus sediminum]
MARHNGGMGLRSRLFGRTTSPAVADYERQVGRCVQVLAEASGPRVALLAMPDSFAVSFDGQWQTIGWHQVRTGGWKLETDEMYWRLLDGRSDSLVLTDEGHFPETFRDRVQASVVVEQRVPVPSGGTVVLSARRDLGQDQPVLDWQVQASHGASLKDPETRHLADEALAGLRADYDF